jgi:nucleoside-diphosphate-sugar epimerase
VRVLVTGGTGFVGSHLVAALLERGHSALCLVRDVEKAKRVLGEGRVELARGDLRDAEALRGVCADVDAVAHLAGLIAARSRDEFFQVNAEGTRALGEAAVAAGNRMRRFVLVSSLTAAGPRARGAQLTADGAGPVSNYGHSKRAGEDALRRLGLEWTILRPPAVYGPRDLEFLRLFRMARFGLAPVFGDGAQELSLVYVADLAEAIATCLEVGAPGEVLYPAHEEVTTARELALAICTAAAPERTPHLVRVPTSALGPILALTGFAARVSGRATLLSSDKRAELLAEAWTCSPAPLTARTGWRARTPLRDGLLRTANWYRSAGWLKG